MTSIVCQDFAKVPAHQKAESSSRLFVEAAFQNLLMNVRVVR